MFLTAAGACIRLPPMNVFAPLLTPHGSLVLDKAGEGSVLADERAVRLERMFTRGSGHGLLSLGVDDTAAILPPALSWWRDFGALFVTAICALPEAREGDGGSGGSSGRTVPAPPFDAEQLARLAETPPIMTGAEYLTAEVLAALWASMGAALNVELAEAADASA
jgi:non-specific serine/threonine protein kinase